MEGAAAVEMTPRLYLLALAAQLMAALLWRDCSPWEVVGAVVVIVLLCVVAWLAQELVYRLNERR